MGMEATCRITFGKKTAEGKALLETEEILFRGPFSLKIPFKSIANVEARGGKLHVNFPGGPAVLDLGKEAAEKWFIKIRYPKSLMDKLGVKRGSRVNIDGVGDAEFLAQLNERAPQTAAHDCEIVFFGAENAAVLKRLAPLKRRIKSNGAIWVI